MQRTAASPKTEDASSAAPKIVNSKRIDLSSAQIFASTKRKINLSQQTNGHQLVKRKENSLITYNVPCRKIICTTKVS